MSLDIRFARDLPVIAECAGHPQAPRWFDAMHRFGTNIAGCIAAGQEPTAADGIPRFQNWTDAAAATGAVVCISLAQPRTAADTAVAAAEAGMRFIVTLSPNLPVHDVLRATRRIRSLEASWIGGGTMGFAVPAAKIMVGALPGHCLRPGNVALLSRAGNLVCNVALLLTEAGMGQSILVDLGSDTVTGTRMAGLAAALKADPETRAIVLLGAADGTEEASFAAEAQRIGLDRPLHVYLAGAPAAAARGALEASGANVYNSLQALVAALRETA